ncbi:integrase [Parabacteroides sp. PFB2-12]|uniref:site-specific integrase n=1 Tax=unclassified Parabacteroides TaxID=2649774 RepID=UPI00247467EE|nr:MULTISPECIES: site-specific integrase [unclassified Parabacteroides]MDH6342938.1 integrase [Parabacteroides sp. PM6-13]MDH6391047.1 integrase [Parabacteroides sp. PFB2-12]
MNIKRNIVFSLESRKKNGIPITENVPIRMRVVYCGNRIEFTTGYRIDAPKWDLDKQRVKKGCTNKLKQSASEINSDLSDLYSKIEAVFKEFEVQDTTPTPDQLKDAFGKKNGDDRQEQKNIHLYFDLFMAECGEQNNWALGTIKKLNVVKGHIKDFDPGLTFDRLNENVLREYVSYLYSVGMRNSTIEKQINLLKWFLRWAVSKGHCENTSFEAFKPKLKTTKKKIIFLTWKELTQLREYKIPEGKQYLERVRDVFLFQCFTGLRYSDVYNLKRSDVKEDHIEITTVKTADSLIIELNSHSRAILEKYKDVHLPNSKVLPVISNQKMNEFLKELCELAELNEPIRETYYKGNERIDEVTPKYALIGTHCGRRTFICNALSLGIPAQVVMKWTGHSDYKAMKPYIDIADEIKASAMSKFDGI